MSKRSNIFYIVTWKKYLLLLIIFLSSVYCLYEIKQFHDANILYFYNPFIISFVFALIVGYHFYRLKYYLEGKTFVVEGLVRRKLSIVNLEFISVRKESLDLVNGFSLFSISLRSGIQELNELTALIDGVLVHYPGVKLKGQSEYCRKWFPKTFNARKT